MNQTSSGTELGEKRVETSDHTHSMTPVVPFLLLSCLLFTFTDCLVPDYPWRGDGSWDTVYIEAFKDHPLRKGINLEWLSFLRNKRIAFIGDSLTRYQYLSLAWFLGSGQWLEDPGLPSMIWKQQWPDWGSYFHSTNLRMGCHEILDACPGFGDVRENRYFHHFGLNLTISMNRYSPQHMSKMRLGMDFPAVKDFHSRCMFSAHGMKYSNRHFNVEANSHVFDSIQSFITGWIAPFQPDYLVFNHGIWSPEMVYEPSYLPSVMQAARNASKHVIWKTTTSGSRNPRQYEDDNLRQNLSSLGFITFDAFALTKHLSYAADAYHDVIHFSHMGIYRELNIALLQKLREIEEADKA
eukprot:scaffold1636_cov165-Ochromonas_danica.AAC.18